MKKLESFDFGRTGNGGGHSKHPWSQYIDGSIYQLDVDKDLFNASTRTFQVLLHRQAKKAGKRVRVRLSADKKTLTLQAYVPETADSNAATTTAAESNGEAPETTQPKSKARKAKSK
jgi:hypothetical protein